MIVQEMKQIDVHAHWLPPSYLDAASAVGVRRVPGGIEVDGQPMVGAGLDPSLLQGNDDPDAWVAALDVRGVDHLVVSPSPLLYAYHAPREAAAAFCRFKNDEVQRFAARRPDRLSWVGALPMQDPAAAVEEVQRVAAHGGRGFHVGACNLGDHELDSLALWPVYEAIERTGLSISLHPNPFPVPDPRSTYVLNVFPGYLHQETMAFARLALGGVFDDFPGLQAYLPHGGGAVPFQLGRLRSARVPALGVRARQDLIAYLGNFTFDILVDDVEARRFLVQVVGPERIIVGDNFGAIDEVDGFAQLQECGFDADVNRMVASRNPARLFGLEGVAPGAA